MAEAIGMSGKEFERLIKFKRIPDDRIKNIGPEAERVEISEIESCGGCAYWDNFSWTCKNAMSEHRGNFVNCGMQI